MNRAVEANLAMIRHVAGRLGHSRGNGDFIASHDMEDIITLLDGRPEMVEEVRAAPEEVQKFLSRTFGEFLHNRSFLDALPGHLLPDQASQQRIQILMKRIHAIADIEQNKSPIDRGL